MSEPKPRIVLKEWSPVVTWSLDSSSDVCHICRNSLTERCIQCPAGSSNVACRLSWGKCKHIFHLHCIQNWMKMRRVCPIDNIDWQEVKKTPTAGFTT